MNSNVRFIRWNASPVRIPDTDNNDLKQPKLWRWIVLREVLHSNENEIVEY